VSKEVSTYEFYGVLCYFVQETMPAFSNLGQYFQNLHTSISRWLKYYGLQKFYRYIWMRQQNCHN